ncbi:hypothetical protein FFLO_04919 [Filobasidium floriforme]|uniref:Uncharacterized protein n=1 Tax=Filobasidium floriforme TaxID=5210 RepID=A0A8K0NLX7_9TREE|nr:hypothetical protein FFLO_04919 [Filobasidium floriforme]
MPYNPALLRTPPPLDDTGIRETPRPVKARITELEKQNNILLNQKHALERKQQSELSKLQSEIQALTSSTSTSTAAAQQAQADIDKLQKLCDRYASELKETKEALSAAQAEVQKGKTFGEGMFREKMRIVDNEKAEMQSEFNLKVQLTEQRTALKLAKLETQLIDTERKVLQADQEKLQLKNRLSKASADAADLKDEIAHTASLSKEVEKLRESLRKANVRCESAEGALETLKEARSASDSGAQVKLAEFQASISELKEEASEAQRQATSDKKTIAKLERNVKSLQEREAQLEKEVEELSSEEKAKGGETDKQVKAMRLELKGVKGDLKSKEEEVKELEDEMERIRKEFREKEKSTKRENRENVDLKDKIANLEEEIDSLRRNNAALVEKAKKYRSEARAASSAQPKETDKPASPEPVKKKVTQPVPEITVTNESEEEAQAEVVKAPKRAAREAAVTKKPSKSRYTVASDDDEEEEEEVYVPKPRAGRAGRAASKTTSPAEESGSERDDAPVKKAARASPVESITKPVSLAPKPKSRPAPNFGKSRLEPTIMEEDENDENEPEERDSGKRKSKDGLAPVEVEKKKKRKIGAVAPLAPAFDFNGFLTGASSGNSLIPSILSPMKPTSSSLPRNSLSMSRSFGSSISSSRKMFGAGSGRI